MSVSQEAKLHQQSTSTANSFPSAPSLTCSFFYFSTGAGERGERGVRRAGPLPWMRRAAAGSPRGPRDDHDALPAFLLQYGKKNVQGQR